MAEHGPAPEATERVFLPQPSWAPLLLAAAILAIVNGIFGNGFIVPGWVYSALGAFVGLLALRSMIRTSVRGFYALPLTQRSRSGVLPAASLRPRNR